MLENREKRVVFDQQSFCWSVFLFEQYFQVKYRPIFARQFVAFAQADGANAALTDPAAWDGSLRETKYFYQQIIRTAD